MKNVLAKAQVVLATCHSSGGRQLLNSRFDVVIIDEATQALEAVSHPLPHSIIVNSMTIIRSAGSQF